MNLRTLLPSLAEDVYHALEEVGITTANDLILIHRSQVYQQFPISVARQIVELQEQVAGQVSSPAIRGDELFKREESREGTRESCLCGVDELDGLLGGFGKYGVIEIAGDKRSGKTGLVLQVILRHLALCPNHTAFWLDVGGEFTVERAAAILQLNPGLGFETALDRLSIFSCFDVAAAHRTLKGLQASLGGDQGPHHMRFLVIDPLTPLFAPILNAKSSQGHAVMTTLMRQLSLLARTYAFTALADFRWNLSIELMLFDSVEGIITRSIHGPCSGILNVINTSVQSLPHNPYSAFHTTTKPALGPSFTFLSDETLWLSSAHHLLTKKQQDSEESRGAEVFIAEVFRSHSTISKTWCAFVLRNGISFERFMLSNSE